MPCVSRLIVKEHRMVDKKIDLNQSHGCRSPDYCFRRKWDCHEFSSIIFSYHVIPMVSRWRMRIDSCWYGIPRHFSRECIVWELVRHIVWYWGICIVTIWSAHGVVPGTTIPRGRPLAAVICWFSISPSISSIILLPFKHLLQFFPMLLFVASDVEIHWKHSR